MRRRLCLRAVEAAGTWWQRLLCRLFSHVLAPSPDDATYIWDPGGELRGMLCERCGGLVE